MVPGTVSEFVRRLGLAPHPEGGFFREVHRSAETVRTERGERAAATAIHYLLPAGSFSALHRVASDEVWTFFDGDPLELFVVPKGRSAPIRHVLGRDVAAGETPIAVVPRLAWQAAAPLGERFSWCGCVVAPGFDYADFEMPGRPELLRSRELGAHPDLVRRFGRPA